MAPPEKGKHGRDRLRQLRIFCQTALQQNMSKAAEILNLTQPAVSIHIHALEDELRTTLFERHGPRIALTAAGRALLELALPLVKEMDGLPEALAERIGTRVSGTVHVVAGLTASTSILVEPLQRFRCRYPGVQVRATTGNAGDNLRILRAWDADFALGSIEVVPKDLEFREIASSRHVLIVPEEHPLRREPLPSPKDIAAWPSILPSPDTTLRRVAELTARYFGIEFNVAVETNQWDVMKRYVAAGLGIAVVPELCVTPQDRVKVIRFPDYIDRQLRARRYGVITRRAGSLSLAARELVEELHRFGRRAAA